MRPFQLTPLEKVKVVILTPETFSIGKGTGLGWSYEPEKPDADPFTAPFYFYSMLKELWEDQGYAKTKRKMPTHGDLSAWARQGVFLWNAVPTTLVGQHNSHRSIGWHDLTCDILDATYIHDSRTVYVFIGTDQYLNYMPEDANTIYVDLPSMNNDHFSGCRIFSKINDRLKVEGKKPINWEL